VTLQLTRDLVKYVHDTLVNLWPPYDQIVHRDKFDDLGLLESALARPFQTFGGRSYTQPFPPRLLPYFTVLFAITALAMETKELP
jgi:hypothetical protein